MPVRRILGGGKTRGVTFWPFLNSSGWWWLISSVFLTRTSCRETPHADGYCGGWPGGVASVSVLSPNSISHFLEEISSLSHSIVFLYFFAEAGSLISPCYSLELFIQMGISFLFSFAFSFSSFLSYLDPKFPFFLAESSFSINFLDPPTMPTLLALSALRRDVPGSPGQAFLLVASACIGSVEAKEEVGSGPWSDCLCLNPPWTHSLCDVGQITSSFWASFSSFTRSE